MEKEGSWRRREVEEARTLGHNGVLVQLRCLAIGQRLQQQTYSYSVGYVDGTTASSITSECQH